MASTQWSGMLEGHLTLQSPDLTELRLRQPLQAFEDEFRHNADVACHECTPGCAAD